MTTQHTPGPWAVYAAPNITGATRRSVCACGTQDGRQPDNGHAENAANAQLIAAAPDLLAALMDILNVVAVCYDDFGNTTTEICQASDFSAARAAIAKATAP